jgi:hypothetical protein
LMHKCLCAPDDKKLSHGSGERKWQLVKAH